MSPRNTRHATSIVADKLGGSVTRTNGAAGNEVTRQSSPRTTRQVSTQSQEKLGGSHRPHVLKSEVNGQSQDKLGGSYRPPLAKSEDKLGGSYRPPSARNISKERVVTPGRAQKDVVVPRAAVKENAALKNRTPNRAPLRMSSRPSTSEDSVGAASTVASNPDRLIASGASSVTRASSAGSSITVVERPPAPMKKTPSLTSIVPATVATNIVPVVAVEAVDKDGFFTPIAKLKVFDDEDDSPTRSPKKWGGC